MKITEDFSTETDLLEIKSVEYLGNLTISILFSDGELRVVEFKPFLEQSLHPAIREYLDERKFRNFCVANGNLNWNDYDLVFPLEDLYKGNL